MILKISKQLIPVALTEFKILLGNVSIMSAIKKKKCFFIADIIEKKEISGQIVNINDN